MTDSSDIAQTLKACFPMLSEAWCKELATKLVKKVEAGIEFARRNGVNPETISVTINARPAPSALAETLRQLRTDRGLTQEQVVEGLDWAHSKLVRIESGESSIRFSDMEMLLRAYGIAIESPEAQEMLNQVRRKKPAPPSDHQSS